MAKVISPSQELKLIRSELKHIGKERLQKYWLDTGSPELHSILGHPDRGLAYGKLIELFGAESVGKSAIASDIMAAAQADGAYGIWVDAENSLDPDWQDKRGVDMAKLCWIYPYIGKFSSDKKDKQFKNKIRMASAQEMLTESEMYIEHVRAKDPKAKFFKVIDSVTALLTIDEMRAGIAGQNMRTKLDLPAFLGRLLRRWVGFNAATHTTTLFINQTRVNPTQLFGNPEYQPGGKALKFYCHIRAGIRRGKGGRMMHAGRQTGIQGFLQNQKNKVGGVEWIQTGYKISFSGTSEFLDAKEIKKALGGKEGDDD